jgi:hypothetical protein
MRSYHGEAVRSADKIVNGPKNKRSNKPVKQPRSASKKKKQKRTHYNENSTDNDDDLEKGYNTPAASENDSDDDSIRSQLRQQAKTQLLQAKSTKSIMKILGKLQDAVFPGSPVRSASAKPRPLMCPKEEPPSDSDSEEEGEGDIDEEIERQDIVPKFKPRSRVIITHAPEYIEKGSAEHVDSDIYRTCKGPNGKTLGR